MKYRSLSTTYSWLIASFMLASGAAALIYQVVWARLLSPSIGSTSAAIAIVLAAFFLGLALGAWLSETFVTKQTKSIACYLWLELTIALTALTLLPILLNLDAFIAQWPTLAGMSGFKFILVMVLLGIPTTCMGATFPVMVSLLARQQAQHKTRLRLGQLYGLNTAGGVLGATLGGFVFIPNWGLDGSTYIAASLNFAIVIIGLLSVVPGRNSTLAEVNGSAVHPILSPPKPPPRSFSTDTTLRQQALVVLFFTGMISLACEVGWTRYLSIYTHTTIYGFAAILAIFLTGIAMGAWAINRWLERLTQPRLWLVGGLVALGLSLLLTRIGLNALPDFHRMLTGTLPSADTQYSLIFALLFPATFLFGALFTLNLRIASDSNDSLRHPVGKAYALNTLGGIVGAIGAGLWLIPGFGTDTVLKLTATIPLLLAFMFYVPSPALVASEGKRMLLAIMAGLLLIGNSFLPPLDFRPIIKAQTYYFDTGKNADQPIHFLKEGRSGVISVTEMTPQVFVLQRDGLAESMIHTQRPNFLITNTLLGLAPYLLHAAPRSAFVVGLGGATTLHALNSTELESIRVMELDPVIIEAVQSIYGGNIPALLDPRVELVMDDARQRLLLEDRQYDLIISQPSHPWLSGNANMYSQEFLHLARDRLTNTGIYSQWVNIFYMDATTLRSILKTFFDTFPYGMSMVVSGESGMLLLGSMQPLQLDYPLIQQRLASPAMQTALAQHNIRQPQDLLRYFALSREEALQAAGNIQTNTDTNLFTEVQLASLRQKPTGEEDPYSLFNKYHRFDLTAYFEEQELSQRYQEAEVYFRRKNNPRQARLVREQLQKLSR